MIPGGQDYYDDQGHNLASHVNDIHDVDYGTGYGGQERGLTARARAPVGVGAGAGAIHGVSGRGGIPGRGVGAGSGAGFGAGVGPGGSGSDRGGHEGVYDLQGGRGYGVGAPLGSTRNNGSPMGQAHGQQRLLPPHEPSTYGHRHTGAGPPAAYPGPGGRGEYGHPSSGRGPPFPSIAAHGRGPVGHSPAAYADEYEDGTPQRHSAYGTAPHAPAPYGGGFGGGGRGDMGSRVGPAHSLASNRGGSRGGDGYGTGGGRGGAGYGGNGSGGYAGGDPGYEEELTGAGPHGPYEDPEYEGFGAGYGDSVPSGRGGGGGGGGYEYGVRGGGGGRGGVGAPFAGRRATGPGGFGDAGYIDDYSGGGGGEGGYYGDEPQAYEDGPYMAGPGPAAAMQGRVPPIPRGAGVGGRGTGGSLGGRGGGAQHIGAGPGGMRNGTSAQWQDSHQTSQPGMGLYPPKFPPYGSNAPYGAARRPPPSTLRAPPPQQVDPYGYEPNPYVEEPLDAYPSYGGVAQGMGRPAGRAPGRAQAHLPVADPYAYADVDEYGDVNGSAGGYGGVNAYGGGYGAEPVLEDSYGYGQAGDAYGYGDAGNYY